VRQFPVYLMVFVGVVSLLDNVIQTGPSSTHGRREVSQGIRECTDEVIDSDGDGVADEHDLCPGTIAGTSFVDSTGCPTEIDPFADLEFDDKLHRAWYRRFWTGDCKDVKDESFWEGFKCKGGKRGSTSPREQFWYDTVDRCLQKLAPAERGPTRFRLWELGRLVGHEWARANNIRKIDSNDMKDWGKTLIEAKAEELHPIIEDIFEKAVSQLESD
jgi:hypothetical protein